MVSEGRCSPIKISITQMSPFWKNEHLAWLYELILKRPRSLKNTNYSKYLEY